MEEKINRKTVFLYPDLHTLERQVSKETSQLITDIIEIVEVSNKLIEQILSAGSFSFIKFMPTVSMQCVTENFNNAKDEINNVRICITKSHIADYTEHYKKIITEYKSGQSDISHLVALHINKSDCKIRFTNDPDNNFDTIIEINREQLGNILISIMLDISLYHYFSLSRDIKDRKTCNAQKYNYIINKLDKDERKQIYGNTFEDGKSMYLPFSLKATNTLSKRTKAGRRKEAIDELIIDYGKFISKTLAIDIRLNKNGNIIDPYKYNEIDCFHIVEDSIKCLVNNNNLDKNSEIILIVSRDKTTNDFDTIVIKYDEKNNIDVSTWISKLNGNVYCYKIFDVSYEVD